MQKQKYVTKESKVHSYIQIPATLLKENLGSTTLLIYGVLLTRVTLSQKNCWTDEFGRVFIIYPISKIAEHIGKSESVVKPLIVTTNLSLQEIKAESNVVKVRIYDRILGMCVPVFVDGDSKRIEEGSNKKEILKEMLLVDAGGDK